MLGEVVCPSSSLLDYRFGWRWLLPLVRDDQVLLLGFTGQELAFWKQVLVDATVTDDASNATVWLVNHLWPDCTAGLESAQLRSLCVVGPGKVVAAWHRWIGNRFEEVSDYALLPSSSPRVAVPLGKRDWVVQSLALHRPGRWIARVAVALLKGLARVGIDHPLRARMLCIANKDVGIPPRGASLAGLALSSIGAPQSFALYLGTPDAIRKTVILPLNDICRTILKQGESPEAKAALCNEAGALRVMSQTPLALQVPELFDVVERDGSVTLHQEYRPRQHMSADGMKRAAVEFLAELSRHGRRAIPLAEVLAKPGLMTADEARAAGQQAYARVRERLDALAAAGTVVWGHRSHGDFAPWNCAWTAKGFFVYDWEESQPWDVALGDAFYFSCAHALHVVRTAEPTLVEFDALAFGAMVVDMEGLVIGDIRMYWALWLLRRMTQKPMMLYEKLLTRLAA